MRKITTKGKDSWTWQGRGMREEGRDGGEKGR